MKTVIDLTLSSPEISISRSTPEPQEPEPSGEVISLLTPHTAPPTRPSTPIRPLKFRRIEKSAVKHVKSPPARKQGVQGLVEIRLEMNWSLRQSEMGGVLKEKLQDQGAKVVSDWVSQKLDFEELRFATWQRWSRQRRTTELTFLGHEPYLLFIFEVEEFMEMLSRRMDGFITKVKTLCPECQLGLLVVGVETYLKSKRSKMRMEFDNKVVELQLKYQGVGCLSVKDVEQGVNHLLCLTSTFQKQNLNKQERNFFSVFGGCRNNKALVNLDLTLTLENEESKKEMLNWIHLLHTIPGVAPSDAYTVARRFRSFEALMEVLMDPTKSTLEKKKAIQGVRTSSDKHNLIGSVATAALYNFFLNEDPESFPSDN